MADTKYFFTLEAIFFKEIVDQEGSISNIKNNSIGNVRFL